MANKDLTVAVKVTKKDPTKKAESIDYLDVKVLNRKIEQAEIERQL